MTTINKEYISKLLMDLVSIKSPYFEEDEVMDYVYKWFTENNINVSIHEYHEARVTGFKGKNLIVNLEGNKPGPTIHLNGHLDTVKLASGWTKNPEGEIDGDKLYGVGALDMKSGCVASMVALKAFLENHKDFRGRIISSYVSVEEGPYGMGTNALIEDGCLKDIDISISTEPSAGFSGNPFPDISLGARGGYGLEIELFGKSSHAATPEAGISAAMDAAKLICELDKVEYIKDPHLGKGDVCVVGIECDGGACSVPDYAKIRLFWHIVIGEDQESIRKEIKKAIRRAKIESGYNIKFREAPSKDSEGFMPYIITGEEALAKEFIETVEETCENKPNLSYFASIGDFNYLGSRLNAPAIIFGAYGENFHGPDEYVILDTLVKTSKTIYNYLKKILCD